MLALTIRRPSGDSTYQRVVSRWPVISTMIRLSSDAMASLCLNSTVAISFSSRAAACGSEQPKLIRESSETGLRGARDERRIV